MVPRNGMLSFRSTVTKKPGRTDIFDFVPFRIVPHCSVLRVPPAEHNGSAESSPTGGGEKIFFDPRGGPKMGQKYYPVWDSNPQPSD